MGVRSRALAEQHDIAATVAAFEDVYAGVTRRPVHGDPRVHPALVPA